MKQFNKKMREYLPGVADDDALFQCLESANCSYEKEERPLRLAQLMYELETMRSCLKGIINKRPHLFLRKSKEVGIRIGNAFDLARLERNAVFDVAQYNVNFKRRLWRHFVVKKWLIFFFKLKVLFQKTA